MYSLKPIIRIFLFVTVSSMVGNHLCAQDAVIENYLSVAGDFSSIYSGQIKADYNSLQYDNNPYYRKNEFVEGELILNNNLRYPNQKLRIDLYADQLEILSPQSHYGIIADTRNLYRAILGKETFVLLVNDKKNGIGTGFYKILSEGRVLKLYQKEKKKILTQGILIQFYSDIKYYTCFGGKYSQVKNKNSFVKLFPQFKQEINKFAKENKLNFSFDHRERSLTMLADFCRKLISDDDVK